MVENTPDAGKAVAIAAVEGLGAFATLALLDGPSGAWIAAILGAGAAGALATRAPHHRALLVHAAMVLGAAAALQAARGLSESLLPAGPIVMGVLVARAIDQRRQGLIGGPIATVAQLFGVWVASDLR